MGVLLLVRHGQASFGAEDYDVLSELGVAQAGRTGEALAAEGVTPRVVVPGSMRRQRDTAAAMVGSGGWSVSTEVDARWDEFDHVDLMAAHGGMVGDLDRREFQRTFEVATGQWLAGDGEYAESFAGFADRIGAALDAASESVGSGETGVVVTSGGVIAVVCGLLTLGSRDPADLARVWGRFNAVTVNASVTRVLVGASGTRLLSFNEHAFLPRALVTYR